MSQQNLLVLRYSRQYESPVPPKLLQPGSAMCEILNSGWNMRLTWSISAVLCRGSWHSVWFSPYKYIFGFLLSHRSYRIQLFWSVWISSNILFVFNICVASFFSWSDLGYNVAHFCPYTYMTYRHDVIRELHKLVCLWRHQYASYKHCSPTCFWTARLHSRRGAVILICPILPLFMWLEKV